jgi:hypothetical protein
MEPNCAARHTSPPCCNKPLGHAKSFGGIYMAPGCLAEVTADKIWSIMKLRRFRFSMGQEQVMERVSYM